MEQQRTANQNMFGSTPNSTLNEWNYVVGAARQKTSSGNWQVSRGGVAGDDGEVPQL